MDYFMPNMLGLSRFWVVTVLAGLVIGQSAVVHAASDSSEELSSQWPSWGASPEGTRYSGANQITPDNVEQLQVAWTYSTGELKRRPPAMLSNSSSETTPILASGSLVTCTPFGRVIALDPATGREKWVFDPEVNPSFEMPNQYLCRGVAQWRDSEAEPQAICSNRILYTTVDLRLIALDARTGKLCKTFGDGGQILVAQGVEQQHLGELKLASPPAVVGDVVAMGSMILDNVRASAPRGIIYGYSARTGELQWQFQPIPQEGPQAESDWLEGSNMVTGAANMWSAMSVDTERDLLFLPTSSASPDYYGGNRPGDNRHANSIVALRGSTGEAVWSYQLVHHDIWDYDTPAQPTLADIERDGEVIPAVVQPTKQGFLFVFDRRNGKPVFPINEVPVPQDGAVTSEWLSPTQPMPTLPEPLFDTALAPDDAFGFTFWDRGECRKLIEKYRFDGLYTPPSLEGTITYPAASGGANWGGAAVDSATQTLYINSSRVASVITLIPRRKNSGDSVELVDGNDISPMKGTPYEVKREWLVSPLGAPCTPPPWGGLSAYDLRTGKKLWDVPLGTINHKLPVPLPFDWNLGTPNIGGPVATAGGVLFIAATMDQYLRAIDMKTGDELWKDKLPAGSQTTPMSYEVDGRQYVVISTGSHLWFQTPAGDKIVAYALPLQ
jgi:quinoprotein glucose dehydrogenase